MSQSISKPSLIHAIFLVSGTSIGAGMLAQPVASSLMGFLPATMMLAVCWAFMAATALILVEVCLWMPKGSHVISLAQNFLGPVGKGVAWFMYLFMAYLSLTAYISGGGDIFHNAAGLFGISSFPHWVWMIVFAALFSLAIEIGNTAVSKLNTFLFSMMVISYCFVILIGFEGIRFENLLKADLSKSYVILPLLLASFSFQMMVPSLVSYLEQDRRRLRMAIILGTGVSFLIYALWNGVVLGHESSLGDAALAQAYADGRPPTQALSGAERSWFALLIKLFAFFALATSFIGISWGLFDFLADGLKIKKVGQSRVLLWVLVVIPPFLLASSYPEGFISALESTGAYGDTILNALIPILMFVVGVRYRHHLSRASWLGSAPVLMLLASFALAVIGYELYRQFLI